MASCESQMVSCNKSWNYGKIRRWWLRICWRLWPKIPGLGDLLPRSVIYCETPTDVCKSIGWLCYYCSSSVEQSQAVRYVSSDLRLCRGKVILLALLDAVFLFLLQVDGWAMVVTGMLDVHTSCSTILQCGFAFSDLIFFEIHVQVARSIQRTLKLNITSGDCLIHRHNHKQSFHCKCKECHGRKALRTWKIHQRYRHTVLST